MNLKIPGLKRGDELEHDIESDFATDGTKSWCTFCGVIKEASARFFIEHYRECVGPRREEKEGL